MDELRRAVQMMRDDFDLLPALEDHVVQFGQRMRLETRFEASGTERNLDPQTQLCLFHVLKEALANVARHAAAKTATVSLRFDEKEAVLRVVDDGAGFDPELPRPGHYGVRNMRERAERVGAVLKIESGAGKGTSVELRVPYRPEP
jgi:signal transduction histidine kinase